MTLHQYVVTVDSRSGPRAAESASKIQRLDQHRPDTRKRAGLNGVLPTCGPSAAAEPDGGQQTHRGGNLNRSDGYLQ